jgi:hypothetical protein
MYFAAIVLLMLVLPVASIVAEASLHQGVGDPTSLIGKWFIFWGSPVSGIFFGQKEILRNKWRSSPTSPSSFCSPGLSACADCEPRINHRKFSPP